MGELGHNPPHEEDSDEQSRGAAANCHQRGEQPKSDLAGAHQPSAWSRIRAVNGGPPGGVMLKPSAQRPTMTSAGAERE